MRKTQHHLHHSHPTAGVVPTITDIEVGTVDTTHVVITLSAAVVILSNGAYKDGWTVAKGGTNDAVTAGVLHDSTHIYLTLTSAVAHGNTVTYAYTNGNLVDALTGTAHLAESSGSVTNNV